jgi:hypothetical protein
LSEIEEESNNRYTFIFKKGEKLPLKQFEQQLLNRLEREE